MRLFDRWLRRNDFPIGIDFGSRSFKVAQAARTDEGELRLAAAVSVDFPEDRGKRLSARLDVFGHEMRTLLARGTFSGRNAIVALPAAWVKLHRLRVPMALKPHEIEAAVRSELTDHLPAGSPPTLIQHVVAGEVYHGQELRREVIGVSAPKGAIEARVSALSDAGLKVMAMPTEVQALANWHAADARSDGRRGQVLIDLGHQGARVYVVQGKKILFARAIRSAVRNASNKTSDEMSALANANRPADVAPVDATVGIAMLHGPTAQRLRATSSGGLAKLLSESSDSSARLVEEIRHSCRYFESAFPQVALDRAVFVGGTAAALPQLCRAIANAIDLPAQVANPAPRPAAATTLTAMFAGDRVTSGPAFAVAAALALTSAEDDRQRTTG